MTGYKLAFFTDADAIHLQTVYIDWELKDEQTKKKKNWGGIDLDACGVRITAAKMGNIQVDQNKFAWVKRTKIKKQWDFNNLDFNNDDDRMQEQDSMQITNCRDPNPSYAEI